MGFSTLYGGIKDDVEKTIKDELGDSHQLTHHRVKIPTNIKNEIHTIVKQKFFKDELNLWTITNKNIVTHYAIIDNSIGKSMPITFLVIFDNNGNIVYTNIVKYREPYGGEISSKSWTSQFLGLSKESSFKVGHTIDGISGATISTYSVSKGIQKLCLLFPHIIKLIP